MLNATIVDNYRKNIFSVNWGRQNYLYSIGLFLLGIWTLYLHGADFLTLYFVVAALLVATTPLIFKLPIKYRKRTIKFCSYGQLALAGFCIVLILASMSLVVVMRRALINFLWELYPRFGGSLRLSFGPQVHYFTSQ